MSSRASILLTCPASASAPLACGGLLPGAAPVAGAALLLSLQLLR